MGVLGFGCFRVYFWDLGCAFEGSWVGSFGCCRGCYNTVVVGFAMTWLFWGLVGGAVVFGVFGFPGGVCISVVLGLCELGLWVLMLLEG